MTKIHLVLADDHALVRAGLRSLIERMPDMQIVGEAANGRDALARIGECHPDVALLDIALPGLTGLEALVQARAEHPSVKVVMLTAHANEEYVLRALRAGAAGYLLKDSPPAELELAIRTVMAGDTFLSAKVSHSVIASYLETVGGAESVLASLSPRQREVLQLVAEGRSTKEIATILEIGVKTVETHRAQLMERLQIFDVAGLVRFAVRTGLVSAES
jgi:DNA-binding NarL/FixJ family response regulator